MCGIAGFIGGGNREIAEAMQFSLKHRGPDAGNSELLGSVGLAHRRLAVLDLSEVGSQPMSTPDGRFIIVYNGEVFNYRTLREQYLSSEKFRSETDTEVILLLFQKLGVKAFSHLEGMYALAIYDRLQDELILHRDRLGKKPLYYATLPDDTFVFGSELKSLHKHPSFRPKVDPVSVQQYLLYEYVPTPNTIYKDVYKLEPGQILQFQGNKKISSFVSSVRNQSDFTRDPLLTLEELLSSAVEKRMVADVPVGIFLSGGLDSSLVASFAQTHSASAIKTFSIGFEQESFNEQASARKVAQHLGTEHHEATLGLADITELLPKLPEVLDEPMGDSSIIPTLLVSEYARRQVTVCLSGDGADELFFGYGTFLAHRWAERYQKLPQALRTTILALAEKMPVSHEYMSLDFKLKRFLKGCLVESRYRNTMWLSSLEPGQIQEICNDEVNVATLFAPADGWHRNQPTGWESLSAEYIQGYLMDDILVKTDRASMHYGLEVRSPFLDEQLVFFATHLDVNWKLRGRIGKYILKKLAESRLPKDIVWRKKQGFNFPVGMMIRGELRQEFESTILDGGLQKLNMFRRDKLERILTEHTTGKADNRKALWSLYVLGKWAEKWV